MRIVNIIQRYYPAIGGSETWCQGICRYLSKQGIEIKVLTMNVFNEDEYWNDPPIHNCPVRLGRIEYDGNILIKRYKRTKIKPLFFPFFKYVLDKQFKIYFYGPHSLEMYFKMANAIKYADIVHLHTIPHPHNFIGYFIARHFSKKVVITPHFHPGHHFYERKSNYWLMKNCDVVFAVSDFEKEYFINKGLDSKKIFVTYNAIDPDEYMPSNLDEFKRNVFLKYNLEKNTKIVLFIGRKIEYKGADILIEAVRKIICKHHNVKLFLIGPDFPWFVNFYAKLLNQEKEKIINLGIVTHQEKINFLHLCDLLALPSQYEAFGIVFLEAWICGKPVIGTENGAMPKLLENCGLTCTYGDVNDLKEKIELALFNGNLSKKMALNGKNKVLTHYTWDKVGSKIFDIYKVLLKN